MVMKIMDEIQIKRSSETSDKMAPVSDRSLIIPNIVVYAIDVKAGVLLHWGADLSGLRCRYFLLPRSRDV